LARGIISQGSPSEIRQRQWVALAQALFHRARRTMLGDDGNLMQADGNSFPVSILGIDDWGNMQFDFKL
jgi:hypothetical protein